MRQINVVIGVIAFLALSILFCCDLSHFRDIEIEFEVDSIFLAEGQCATLTWNVENALKNSINNKIGSVEKKGSVTVCPLKTTVFTITASHYLAKATSSVKIVLVKDFHKYDENPILVGGKPGSFDYGFVLNPTVIKADSNYYMLYDGDDGLKIPNKQSAREIGLAISADGLSFQKYNDNPVITRGPENWDSYKVGISSNVIFSKNARWKVYYSGLSQDDQKWAIGLARSVDFRVFLKDSKNPIMTAIYDWEVIGGVKSPCVLFENGIYKMWYTGYGILDEVSAWRIGYAESVDGYSWERNENPILNTDSDLEQNVEILFVEKIFNKYYLFYEANDKSAPIGKFRIFFAVSANGHDFEKKGVFLDLGEGNDWDNYNVLQPSLIFEEERTLLYYCGMYGYDEIDFSTAVIGVAIGPSIF